MTDPRDVVIRAEHFFTTRRQMAEFETGADEIRVLHDTLDEQPALFARVVKEAIDGSAYQRIAAYLGKGVGITIAYDTKESSPENLTVYDEDYGVFYSSEGSAPRIYAQISSIKRASKQIEPLFSSIDDEQMANFRRLECAGIMISWMALGKWLFDLSNPLNVGEPLDENKFLHLAANILPSEPVLELEGAELADKVKNGLMQFRFSLMGMFAYIGLIAQANRYQSTEVPIPDEFGVSLFKDMFHSLLQRRWEGDQQIRGFEYALANPLSLEQAKKGFDMIDVG